MPIVGTSREEEYKKKKELVKEDVKALSDWISKQAHLPKLTENQLILFLHSCLYRIEPTKVCIENYCTTKSHNPEIFTNRDMAVVKKMLDAMLVSVLPERTPGGYHILFVKFLDLNPEKLIFEAAAILVLMVGSLGLEQFGLAEGQMIVVDAAGISFSHLTKIKLALAKRLLFFLQEALPIRLKGIHIINHHPIMDSAISMLRPFLLKELLDMIRFHTKLDDFFKYVPKGIMPAEYGGSAGTLIELKEKTFANLLENEKFFKDEEKLVTNEGKRVAPSKYLDEIAAAGVDGSFKKLDFD